jgi:hypothetical protein
MYVLYYTHKCKYIIRICGAHFGYKALDNKMSKFLNKSIGALK